MVSYMGCLLFNFLIKNECQKYIYKGLINHIFSQVGIKLSWLNKQTNKNHYNGHLGEAKHPTWREHLRSVMENPSALSLNLILWVVSLWADIVKLDRSSKRSALDSSSMQSDITVRRSSVRQKRNSWLAGDLCYRLNSMWSKNMTFVILSCDVCHDSMWSTCRCLKRQNRSLALFLLHFRFEI